MTELVETGAGTAANGDQTSSAGAWFASGERVSYNPKPRAIVTNGDAPFRIFSSQEGDIVRAVSFSPGFPDGSFGWAKVRPHLPNAAEMPKLFLDYVEAPPLGGRVVSYRLRQRSEAVVPWYPLSRRYWLRFNVPADTGSWLHGN